MKPEYFIYKSDGLYYMQNMPEKPVANRSGFGMFNMFEYESKLAEYKAALERAKAEAVKVVEGELLIAEYIIKQVYDIHEVRDYRKGMKSYLEEGCVYTINMEENIVVVSKNCNSMGCSCGGKIARIAAPKKEEESEDHLWNLVLSTYGGEFYHAGQYDEAAIISKIKEEFEIKRKPL